MRIERIVRVSDNQWQANELRNRISESFSDNFSRTLRSRLIGVSKCGKWAFTQETEGEYELGFEPAIGIQKRPVTAIHTAFFGV